MDKDLIQTESQQLSNVRFKSNHVRDLPTAGVIWNMLLWVASPVTYNWHAVLHFHIVPCPKITKTLHSLPKNHKQKQCLKANILLYIKAIVYRKWDYAKNITP